MRKIRRFIIRNWFWLVVGIVLTRKAVEYAYIERGYADFGGEWFVCPIILMAVHLAREMNDMIHNLFYEDGEYYE